MKLILSGMAAAAIAISPAAAADQTANPDKIVCKRAPDTETGSNIRSRKKVCMKASEWKSIDKQNELAKIRLSDQIHGPRAPDPTSAGGTGN